MAVQKHIKTGKTHATKHRPATGKEIKECLGRDDPALLSGLLQTGASLNEITQACEWLDDDDYMGGDLGKSMSPRTRMVCRLLQEEEQPDESKL